MRTEILRFNGAVKRDPAIDAWMKARTGELGSLARQWFDVMRECGDEVRELLHDGHPVACLGDRAFQPLLRGTGWFEGVEGMMTDNSVVGIAPETCNRELYPIVRLTPSFVFNCVIPPCAAKVIDFISLRGAG